MNISYTVKYTSHPPPHPGDIYVMIAVMEAIYMVQVRSLTTAAVPLARK